MSERTRTLGAALALCAALVVTMAVTEAEAYVCPEVTGIRVTTRTLNTTGSATTGLVRLDFGDVGYWKDWITLDNADVVDFKEGAIDEFTRDTIGSSIIYPDHFRRLQMRNLYNPGPDPWGLAGFKVEIECYNNNSWYVIYTDRGLNKTFVSPDVHLTSVGQAGTDQYNGDHEVFWLMNIGDNGTDGRPEDLENCNSGTGGIDCRVQAVLEDSGNDDLLNGSGQLTNSLWDVFGPGFVNPLQAVLGEFSEDDSVNPPVRTYWTDNIWRWFWTGGSFAHSQVNEARVFLDQCNTGIPPGTGTCTMQLSYLHSTVMQAWGSPTYNPYPYFRSHIYEADLSTADSGGWLTVTGFADTDSAATTNVRYYGFGGAHRHVEAAQDSEHTSQQMRPACGYKSLDMILSTRGFSYEKIPTAFPPLWDDPAFDQATTWEEASALAHLIWGYKAMCCGALGPTCCPDADNCLLDGSGPICDSTTLVSFWRPERCLESNMCFGGPDDDPYGPVNARFFWRDNPNLVSGGGNWDGTVSSDERFTGLIDAGGKIHWECRDNFDDDFDTVIDEGDPPIVGNPDEFWAHVPSQTTPGWTGPDGERLTCIRGAEAAVLQKILTLVAPGSSTSRYAGAAGCGIDPDGDWWFGDTMSVIDALNVGFGMYFGWDHTVGECDNPDAGHYSVLDGYERIYHPGTQPAYYDYLFFVADPNSNYVGSGTDYDYEGEDNIGFSEQDFIDSVRSVTIWNYDFYK